MSYHTYSTSYLLYALLWCRIYLRVWFAWLISFSNVIIIGDSAGTNKSDSEWWKRIHLCNMYEFWEHVIAFERIVKYCFKMNILSKMYWNLCFWIQKIIYLFPNHYWLRVNEIITKCSLLFPDDSNYQRHLLTKNFLLL